MNFQRFSFIAKVSTADGNKATMDGSVVAGDAIQAVEGARKAVAKLLTPRDTINTIDVRAVASKRRAKR